MTLFLLLTTVTKKSDARRLATAALERRFAACIQILPRVESHYLWNKKKIISREYLILAKTTPRQSKSLEKLWKKIHPYDCPELVTLSARAAAPYARWIQASLSP